MLEINVPSTAWSTNSVSLGDILYRIDFRFNSTDERWRMDIYIEDDPVILGVKIMESQDLVAKYRLAEFNHGDIFCIRRENDNLPVGRDNLGFNRPYGLFYFSNSELGL